jgi:hypothetical protein
MIISSSLLTFSEQVDGRFRRPLEISVSSHSSVDRQGCADDVGCFVRAKLLACFVVSAGNDDLRSFTREGQGGGTTDTGESTSDQNGGSVHIVFFGYGLMIAVFSEENFRQLPILALFS